MSLFGRSRIRDRILVEFFRKPGNAAHVREMARRIEASPAAVGTELAALARLGVLRSETVGRSVVYSVNERSPLLTELRALVQKTLGVEAEIAEALEGLKGVEAAYLYGSYASGEERPGSDIDLLVIGRPDAVALSERLAPVESKLRRDVNVLTRSQAQIRSRQQEPFWRRVLSGPLVHVSGRQIGF